MSSIPNDKLKEILIGQGLIPEAEFDELAKESERMTTPLGNLLVSRSIISADYLAEVEAKYLGVELAHLSQRGINQEVLKILTEDVARQRRVAIFAKEEDGTLDVAMEDPSNLETIELLERRFSAKVKTFLATEDDLNKAFALYGKETTGDFKQLIEENIQQSLQSRARGEEAVQELPIVALVDNLLSYGVSLRASDIHIEALEDTVLVRYRIDGILHEIMRIQKEVHPALVARVKFLSNLKLDEHAKPQDGRFRHKIGTQIVDVRVAIMPTFHGEKVEMRLLTAAERPLSFDELGMLSEDIAKLRESIKKSFGMIIVCGPTGSGKTTTLYSVLNILNRPEVNIVTVEDPIEYNIQYVNQTQINPQAGITFASGLRSILRQDPNIIMVGEIRDNETADIAVQSALTGHLVLSSLHTNNAPTAVPRLLDMKIPNFLVSAVLNVILAQRLVRRICLACIESYKPKPETIDAIKKQVSELGLESEFKEPKILFRGKGCDACGGIGFQGRIGIYELLDVDEELRALIESKDMSLDSLTTLARKKGMVTMFEDGLRKVERGITTIEEVMRVIRE